MFWEIIATVIAGLGTAGIVLSLRLLFKRLPKWLVPCAAGLGMLGFQLYSEYTWFTHTSSRLPTGASVVAKTGVPAFYKPWSYYHAPVLKFIAVDHVVLPTGTPDIYETKLYFFERRMPAETANVLVDCKQGLQSELLPEGQNDTINFGKTAFSDALIAVTCPNPPKP